MFVRLPRGATAVPVQPSLWISHPADPDEREAEAVANRVAEGGSAGSITGSDATDNDRLHRLSAESSPSLDDISIDEQEEGDDLESVQALHAAGGPPPHAAPAPEMIRRPTGGRAIDPDLQVPMQDRFGVSFGNVRIHSDTQAAGLAASIGARAFTFGRDIYFGAGEYRPTTTDGRRVLAHELTHVLQQRATTRQVSTERPRVMRLGAPVPPVTHEVRPWGASGPIGSNHVAATDGGSNVEVWIAYPIFNQANSYWCHGHSLGTYARHGYSVYSGPPMATAVRDEWTNVPSEQTRAGDIAVWVTRYDHSARFTAPSISNGTLDPDASMLSTKNGRSSLATMSLSAIASIYGSAGIAVFRRR